MHPPNCYHIIPEPSLTISDHFLSLFQQHKHLFIYQYFTYRPWLTQLDLLYSIVISNATDMPGKYYHVNTSSHKLNWPLWTIFLVDLNHFSLWLTCSFTTIFISCLQLMQNWFSRHSKRKHCNVYATPNMLGHLHSRSWAINLCYYIQPFSWLLDRIDRNVALSVIQ